MCGRATLATPKEVLRELFKLEQMPLLNPRYNIAPSQDLAVIREPRHLELMHWGLANAGNARGINVRAETVARAPMYRESFRQRRCLVIVDGFFEWKRGPGKKKQPYLVRRTDGLPFALAGLWQASAEGEPGCAIITGAAAGVVAELHDRMPIIIPSEHQRRWLDPNDRGTQALLVPDASDLCSHPVSGAVNNPQNDAPALIEPADTLEAGDTLELF